MRMRRYFNINYSAAAHLGRAGVSELGGGVPEASDTDGLMLTLCPHYLPL